jgi:hypothetical protein
MTTDADYCGEEYREQNDWELGGDPRASIKARGVLWQMFGEVMRGGRSAVGGVKVPAAPVPSANYLTGTAAAGQFRPYRAQSLDVDNAPVYLPSGQESRPPSASHCRSGRPTEPPRASLDPLPRHAGRSEFFA